MDALNEIEDDNERFRQMYKYCLVFLQKDLEYTLKVLTRDNFKNIDYSKLVPSFADIKTNDEEKIGLILAFFERY